MPDENQGQNAIAAEKVTQEPMPSSDQPADAQVQDQAPEGQLPEDASDRTRAEFEKLKEANKRLKEELEAKSPPPVSVLDSLRPQGQAPKQQAVPDAKEYENLKQSEVDNVVKSIVDEDGYVNEAKLKKILEDANAQAELAKKEAESAKQMATQASERVTKFEETEQTKRTHADFPALDPSNKEKFDPRFYELVRNEMIGQLMNGKQDFHAAAEKVKSLYDPDQKQQDAQIKRDQATSAGQSGRSQPTSDSQDELVRKSYEGDRNAIYERLKRSGF